MNDAEKLRKPRSQFFYRAADSVISTLLIALGPLLWRLAHYRTFLPASVRRAEAAGVAVIKYHYGCPMVRSSDLRYPLDRPRPLPAVDLNIELQRNFLAGLDFADELLAIPVEKKGSTQFGYSNGWFESGDAEILYGIIRRGRPRLMVEIGSGQSTLMARLAIARNQLDDPHYVCEHVCIEPYEAPWLEKTGVTVLRERVEKVDLGLFDRLRSGDILFVDSSHMIRPQGDVLFEILEIYPRLAPGVLVHVHDIFTPRDYREDWVLRHMHMWNEQYILEAFLSFNPNYEIVCALNWLANDHRGLLERACPVLLERFPTQPGSFWMRRK